MSIFFFAFTLQKRKKNKTELSVQTLIYLFKTYIKQMKSVNVYILLIFEVHQLSSGQMMEAC
jgi:hypothetical protein